MDSLTFTLLEYALTNIEGAEYDKASENLLIVRCSIESDGKNII
jgi:hypothetical protein